MLGALDHMLFDNLKNIADAKAPVAIVHGTHDTVVSVKNAEMLHLCTPNSLKYAPLYMDASHNGVLDCTGKNAGETKKYIGDFITYLKNESGASEYPAGLV